MSHVTPPDDRGRDRVDEAWAWLSRQLKGKPAPPLVALIGIGNGELFEALGRHAPDTRVLALEPDAGTAAAFRATGTGRAWIETGRVAFLAGPDYAGADEAWRCFPASGGSTPVLVHPSLKPTPDATRAARVLKQILAGVAANREARRRFAPRYLVNSIRNVPAIVAGSDVRHLADAWRGVPAVIAAAGPSLDAVVPQLRDVHTRALLIACDTALRPLLVSGIAPHLVVGIDPSELNARHMQFLPECTDIWLVSESALDRAATAPFDGRTFWFRVSNHEPWPWLNELALDIGQLDVWGSVLTAAFQVACLAGCDPIVIVGADLSYTGGRPYARGTTYEFDWALAVAGGTPLEQAWQQQISAGALVTVPDLRGQETIATESLVSFRDWLVARAERSGRRVVNATGGGILAGRGVEQGTIAQVLTRTFDVPAPGTFARRFEDPRPTRLAARLREARGFVATESVTHALAARWREFAGDGFEPSAVAGALDEAAAALEAGPKTAAEATSLARWPDLAASVPSDAISTRLSEATARLRVAMTGALSLPAVHGEDRLTHDDRRALLVDALHLLGLIRDELWRMDDLAPIVAPWDAGRRPASVLYAWPERLRWMVQIFEAVLGRAWVSGAPALRDTYFTEPVEQRDDPHRPGETASAPARPHSIHACMLLAREWLACRATLESDEGNRDSMARLSGIESAVRGAIGARCESRTPAVFVLEASASDRAASIQWPLPVDDRVLRRVVAGTIFRPASDATIGPMPRVESAALRISIDPGEPNRRDDAGSRTRPTAAMAHPRLLSSPGERCAIAYPLDDGVVCVRLNDTASFKLRFDGSREPYRSWPRAILSELPFGDGGAVAWASGRADPANIVPPYVMYRRTADEAPIVEDLPFNPSWGAWWKGRLYWGFLPSDVQPGRGLGSWAPGNGARIELTVDAAFFDIRGDETGLLLEPSTRRPDHTYERRLLSSGWRWSPESGLEARPLGPHGASGSRVAAHGLTTTTFPEADLITFEGADGTSLSMAAYYPFRAAWLESSLLVSTVDYQLLLFENVLGLLAAAVGSWA